jgi:DNA polymerase delta subunit 1
MSSIMTPAKRVLVESTNTRHLLTPQLPSSKKRKLNREPSGRYGDENRVSSSLPKSEWEENLEKLTQNINGLKDSNAEKDQQWSRPSLNTFNEHRDKLCFQQIEVEEGTLRGDPTVRLFGVSEVCECHDLNRN